MTTNNFNKLNFRHGTTKGLMDFYYLPSVSHEEEEKTLSNVRFKNLFLCLSDLYTLPTFGHLTRWMVTSINKNWSTGLQRPEFNHTNFRGQDLIPITFTDISLTKFDVILPLPLNRNMLLAQAIKSAAINRSFKWKTDLPFIGLEADHIHSDVTSPGQLILYSEVRNFIERGHPELIKKIHTLNDKSWITIAD